VLGDPAGQFARQCYLSVTMSLSRNGGREVLRLPQRKAYRFKFGPRRTTWAVLLSPSSPPSSVLPPRPHWVPPRATSACRTSAGWAH
jgi:hypothetical protein